MKSWAVAGLLAVVCLCVYWPQQKAEFVLDDQYTVVRNPLIKNPSLYSHIWNARLFDAHPSSGYIRFGYYRPILQFSWIPDYRIFSLKAAGYQWTNLWIHIFNCFLVYIFLSGLFGAPLALKAALLFSVIPTQEWVVRYVTGRGDALSVSFALLSLISLSWVFKNRLLKAAQVSLRGAAGEVAIFFFAFILWVLSALTREVAVSYIFYAFLIYHSPGQKDRIDRFCSWWILIGIAPVLLLSPIVPKQGNILAGHLLYFASVGCCLWIARLNLKWVALLCLLFGAGSFYQGRFWTTEETLLRHTRSLELWPRTAVDQQLLMKYDDNIPAINDMISRSKDPLIRAMWLRRLGTLYFNHRDLARAYDYMSQALACDPSNVDTLNALAVVWHEKGQEFQSLKVLSLSLKINPDYPDTLRTLGVHYYIQKDFVRAKVFLKRSLLYDPDNLQAQSLLRLANKAN